MDFLFVVLYLCVPIIAILLMKYCGLSLLKLSVPSFVITALFVFSYLGLLPLYFGWDSYRYKTGVQDRNIILQLLFFSSFSIITILLTYSLLKSLFFKKKSTMIPETFFPSKGFAVLCLGVIVIVLSMYLSKVSSIPLFDKTKDPLVLAKQRSDMGNSFPGKYHWYKVVMIDLASIISFSLAAFILKNKRKPIALFIIVSIISVFTSLMALEKSVFAWYLIGLFLVFIVVKKNYIIITKSLIVFGIAIMFVLVCAHLITGSGSSIKSAICNILSRTLTGQLQPAYHYLEYFPTHKDFLYGTSFPNPGGLLGFTPFNLTVELMNWKFPEHLTTGIVGTMPTVYWGELYANFGSFGVCCGGFLVGFYLFIIEILAKSMVNNGYGIGLYAWLCLHFKDLALTGISTFIVDFNLIFIFLVISIGYIIVFLTRKRHVYF